MRSLTRLAFCVLLAATTLFSVSTRGYVLNGKWKTSQVGYYINPSTLDMPEAGAIAAIQGGADAWAAQSNAAFSFYYLGTTSGTTVGTNGRAEVFFRNSTNGAAAATTYTYYSNGNIVDADIVIWDGGYHFFPGDAGCSGGVYLQDIATHEFGHAAGIAHSAVSDATMYPVIGWCSQVMRTLATDDQEAIEALYSGVTTSTAPTVAITAPSSNSSFDSSTPVTFSGSATDREDGSISPGIVWKSNLVGQFGTGASVSKVLSAGTHLVTATVSDSNGLSATSQVTVIVTSTTIIPPPSTETGISLSAAGRKVKGLKQVMLSWKGAASSSVDVYRSGTKVMTTANDGSETDFIKTRGAGSYTYKLCDAGTSTCSSSVNVAF
jgi:hypothetical protein